MMQAITMVLIEPPGLFRDGLSELLRKIGSTVLRCESSAESAFGVPGMETPQAVIWGPSASMSAEADITVVRGSSGAETTAFVLLADVADVGWIRRMAALGVNAILSPGISGEILQRSLELVLLGQFLFPRLLAQAPAESGSPAQGRLIPFPLVGGRAATQARNREVVLSEREGQILRCLVDGASNKAIARDLQVTEATVKAHVKGLLRKVRASNRTQAAIWALNNDYQVARPSGQVLQIGPAEAPERRAAR